MDINNIISKISDNNTNVVLHAVIRKKSVLKSVDLKIGRKLEKQIRDITINQLNLNKDATEEEYNIIGSNDDVLEVANKKEYSSQIHNVIESLKKPIEWDTFRNDYFSFFVYEFRINNSNNENDKIFAFRRIKNFKKLNKGFIGTFEKGCYKDIDSKNIFGADATIDLLMYQDDILILRHISFERIFGLSDRFLKYAKDILSNKMFEDKILNFDELKNDALQNMNYIKRLAKLKSSQSSTLFLDNIEETDRVINHFNLDIDTANGKLVYSNKTQLGNFINLMQDAYYRTLIGNHDGIDKGR